MTILNVKIGSERDGKTVGLRGMGEWYECGDKHIDCCKERNLAITNTLCNVHHGQRYTWISSGDRGKKQIDYVMINSSNQTLLNISGSDHDPVIIKLSLKKVIKGKNAPNFKHRVLKTNQRIRENFKQEFFENLPETSSRYWPLFWCLHIENIQAAAVETNPTIEKKNLIKLLPPRAQRLLQKGKFQNRTPCNMN